MKSLVEFIAESSNSVKTNWENLLLTIYNTNFPDKQIKKGEIDKNKIKELIDNDSIDIIGKNNIKDENKLIDTILSYVDDKSNIEQCWKDTQSLGIGEKQWAYEFDYDNRHWSLVATGKKLYSVK